MASARRGRPESVGIDACSPGEVLRALECGWLPDEISYTGTNVSERDLDVLLEHGIHLNLDAISQVERYGRRAPGTRIGIRIDPGSGAGYTEKLEYSGARPTKFGIELARFDDALAAVARHDLVVDTVHFHAGSGWLGDGLAGFERALPAAVEAVRLAAGRGPSDHGGQRRRRSWRAGPSGRAHRSTSMPTPPSWRAISVRSMSSSAASPGDRLGKDAGILLGEVVTVETRRGVTFVGLDLGWNVNCSFFIYRFAQEIVVCRAAGRRADGGRHGRRPHQRGGRCLRRGLPDAAGRRGRHRGDPQRRRLSPGDELDPLPAADRRRRSSSTARCSRRETPSASRIARRPQMSSAIVEAAGYVGATTRCSCYSTAMSRKCGPGAVGQSLTRDT